MPDPSTTTGVSPGRAVSAVSAGSADEPLWADRATPSGRPGPPDRAVSASGPAVPPDRAGLAELSALRARFAASGMVGRIGWGSRPAVVVVDLIRGFTDPASPLGGDLGAVVAATARLVAAARLARVPVVWAAVTYRADMTDAGVWPAKIPAQRLLVEGSSWVGIDDRLTRLDDEDLVVKKHASAFLGTDLDVRLRRLGVDTVLVAGCTTSGCVRATAVDACGLGFRPIVVREAVGDRAALVHEVSLFDLDAKYADVEDLAGVLDRLGRVARSDQTDPSDRSGPTPGAGGSRELVGSDQACREAG